MVLQRKKNIVVSGACLVLMCISLVSGQTKRYVDYTATGADNGTNWDSAHTTLYAALAASSPGDSIFVAAGVYKPTSTPARDSTLLLKQFQRLLGGYPNGGGLRNWRINQTILSGDIGTADSADNSYHVLSIINANNVIVDGFIIEGGYASADTGYHSWGGGIYMSTGWAGDTIRNCIIRKNYAKKRGGGVYVRNIKALLLNCKIYSNRTDSCGGGVYLEDDTTRVINSTFVNNISGQFGGGLYINRTSFAVDTIVNCTFTCNSAINGGGLFASNTGGGRPAIINTILYYDRAPGAAIEIGKNGSSNPGIKNSDIMGCRNNVGVWDTLFGSDMGSNQDTFPRFFDVDGMDNIIGSPDDTLKLQVGSPCYMAGMAGGIIPLTDIDSINRGGSPTIGAYQETVMIPPGKKWENSAKDNRWATSANWFPDDMPLGKDTVIIDGAITSAACTLNVNDSITLINFANNPGLFSFSACTLKVGKDADFSGATEIVPGTGALIFGGMQNHTLKPKPGELFPPIFMNGVNYTNALQIINNPLRAKRLVLNGGTLHLGTYMAKDTVEDIKVISGIFAFGNGQLYVSDSADFRYATSVTPDTGALIFTGAGTHVFNPCFYPFPGVVVQNSAAVTVVDSNTLNIRSLTINAGSSLTAPTNNWMNIKGSFINNGVFTHNNGHVHFDSTTGVHTVNPGGSQFHNLSFGTGGHNARYMLAGPLTADTIRVEYDSLSLGNYTHTVNVVNYGMTSKYLFDACTLKVNKGADFSGNVSISPGTGVLQLMATDTQTLKLPMNDTLPAILHSGAGKLKLESDTLNAVSFTQTAGQLDFNYRDVITTGNFRILNGNSSSLINLRGRTITTGGSAEFQGQSGSLLNLKPDSAWTIAAAGPLTADYAVIGRSTAAGTKGKASARCVDSLNNVNWWFMDSLPPDNDMTLSAYVIDTNKIILYWNPSAIDSNDADSVGIWYKTAGDFPDSAYDPTALLAGKYSLNDSIDTIYGLNKSTMYYFSLMSHDSSGNWSDTATLANKSARTFNPGTKIWKGGAGNQSWTTAANWLPAGVPLITDSVIFNSSSVGVCSVFVSDTIKCMSLESGYTGNVHAGGTYLLVNNALTINSGTLNLWSGVFVGAGSIATAGGSINFGTSTVQVSGDANFSGLDSMKSYATGHLEFAGVGTQVFTPKSSVTHPNVHHTASGILCLAINDLSAASFSNTAGILDLNGKNITTVSSGNFTVSSGTSSTFANLVGRTITVNGNAGLSGQNGNLLNMNAAASWFLNVTGTLNASYAVIGNSRAEGGSTGAADVTCLNAGNNANWNFTVIDTTDPATVSFGPPDNAVMVGLNDNLVITFTEPVNKGIGNIVIAKTSDNSVLEIIAVGGANVTGGGTSVIMINPAASFASKTGYYVRIDSTCFVDTASNKYAGIYSNISWNFTTIDVGTETPSLSFPVSNVTIGDTFTIGYTLPEKALAGSAKMSFIWDGGIPDPNAPHIISFIPGYEIAGYHATILSGNDLSMNANVAGVSSNPNDALVKYAIYYVKIEYQDSLGNAAAQSTHIGVTYMGGMLGNNVNGDLSSRGDTAVMVSLNLISAVFPKVTGIYFNLNKGAALLDTAKALKLRYADTTFTMYNIKDQGLWYGAWALYDSIQSVGVMKYDSVPIGNTTPVVVLPVLDTAFEDSAWILSNCAYDLNGDSITIALLIAPAGVTVLQPTLSIQWTPANNNVGIHTITVAASDGNGGSDTGSMTLLVINTNDNPVVTLPALDTVYEDSVWSISNIASDVDNDTLALSLLNAPAGMTVSQSTLSIQWVPVNSDVGSHTFQVVVQDGKGGKDTAQTTLLVLNTNDNPVLTLPALDTAYVDSVWSISNCASDIDNDQITLTLIAAPAGMTVSQSTLSLAWKPSSSNIGTNTVILSASDGQGGVTKDTLLLMVVTINSAPVLSLPALDTAYEDTAWTITNFVSDVDNDAITLTLLNAPAGMTVSQTNLSLSWKPANSDVGSHPVTVTAVDPKNGRDTATMMLQVLNTNDPPQIDSTAVPSVAFEDSLYKAAIIVSDPDMNDSIVVSLSPALPWLKAESKTMTGGYRWLIDIRGIPGNDNIGTTSVNCIMNDKSGAKVSMIIALVVNNTNDFPHIDSVFFPDTVYEDSMLQGVIRVSDPDNNDTVSLSFTPFMPWLKVQKSQGSTDSLWIFTISGRPGNADTGAIQFTATVRDKGGLPAAITDKIYIINTNDPPQTLLVKRNKTFGALEYIMDGQDDLDTVLTFYATVSDSAGWYDTTITNTTGLFRMYPLPDGAYFFRCYAQDKDGLADPTPFSDTVRLTGVCTKTWADSGTWNMVSIPARSYSPDQFKQAGVIVHWDESNAADDIYKYYVREDAIREITAGKSYWTRLDSSVTVKLNRDSLYKTSCTIRLRKAEYGWNQIASPFIYPVQCNKDVDLWRWNPALRDFEMMTTDVLNPWEGYWVHTDNADSVVLVPQPAFAVKTSSTRLKTGFADKTEWTFGVELSSNINRDADNLFGIHASAKDGCDRLDRAEPPRMGSEPYLYFPHPEWKKAIFAYASDIRQNWNENENVFQIGIAPCSKEVTALALHITGYESGMPVYLFVNSGAGVIPYKPGMAIPLEPSAEHQYRTIFATGDRNFLDRFPQKFTLNNPYPNPCRPAATIRYTLPYRWESNGWLTTEPYKVRLTIYDARGRAICELVNRKQGPGHYRVVWRGRSDTGGRTASGFYCIRLEAGNHSSVKKIIVMQ